MVRPVGLDDRVAWPITTAGTAHRLAEQLVGPFGGALVGQDQGDIETTPTSGDSRYVEPLATRLVPTRTSTSPAVNASMTRSAARADHDIPVEPRDAQAGMLSRTSRSTRSVPPPR